MAFQLLERAITGPLLLLGLIAVPFHPRASDAFYSLYVNMVAHVVLSTFFQPIHHLAGSLVRLSSREPDRATGIYSNHAKEMAMFVQGL